MLLEKIKFINHLNECIDFGSNGIYINENDLHDYAWNYKSDGDRISQFTKGIVKKAIPIVICCDSAEEGTEKRNKLLEICEKDVLAHEHGKIIIGDYYLRCFVTESKKEEYLKDKSYMKATLTVISDYPQWVKESTVSFRVSGEVVGGESTKRNYDYNYDFPFDYMSQTKNKTIVNSGFVDTNFKLIIFGAVSNPTVYIAGHKYQINVDVGENEYIMIDSMSKTIRLTKYNGEIVNVFNKRCRDSYVFQKIPAGSNIVGWNNTFGFDIILLDERSEPKWT